MDGNTLTSILYGNSLFYFQTLLIKVGIKVVSTAFFH